MCKFEQGLTKKIIERLWYIPKTVVKSIWKTCGDITDKTLLQGLSLITLVGVAFAILHYILYGNAHASLYTLIAELIVAFGAIYLAKAYTNFLVITNTKVLENDNFTFEWRRITPLYLLFAIIILPCYFTYQFLYIEVDILLNPNNNNHWKLPIEKTFYFFFLMALVTVPATVSYVKDYKKLKLDVEERKAQENNAVVKDQHLKLVEENKIKDLKSNYNSKLKGYTTICKNNNIKKARHIQKENENVQSLEAIVLETKFTDLDSRDKAMNDYAEQLSKTIKLIDNEVKKVPKRN